MPVRSIFVAAVSLISIVLVRPALATTVGPLVPLGASPAAAAQRAPAVSWDGSRYVVVWEDSRVAGSGIELYLARLSAEGMVVDGSGLALLSPAQPGDQTQPSIAASPSGHHLIAWIDPRSGTAEVFVARFFSSNALLPEPGGAAVTNTTQAAEARPSVACAVQSCLVAFQQTAGATTEVRATRVYPSGDLQDQSPLDLVANDPGRLTELAPATTATTATFFVVWEDDRSRQTGLLGADLYGRTVPDLGSVTPGQGTIVASGDYRQSHASLASLTAQQILAVWQDQRPGTATASEDIWRSRFSLGLQAAAPGATLVQAPRAQLSPKLAGSGRGRALAVWQDFRNGAFGLTYATRVDANGASLDGAGFPVIVQNANMIEHAVAKGPGDDYLVLSVRSSPAPARIYMRIVRDEPPAGSIAVTGGTNVPADGATNAELSFGPARGASGFSVVDGTIFTLALSRGEVTIEPADVDPTRPGHQLASVNGQIGFRLRSLRPGMVDVNLSSIEGTAAGSVRVTFANVPPTVTDVRISPLMPRSDEDLVLSYVYADINGDPEGRPQIQWTKNSALQPAFADPMRVPASAISRGDIWRASVRPYDGTDYAPTFTFSNSVTVLNTPPEALMVRIEPSTGVKTGTTLRGRYTFRDPDADTDRGSELRWYLNGVEQPALANASEVAGSSVQKGQRWRFSVVPNDSFDRGPLVSSATVTVENSAPIAEAGMNAEVTERRSFTLDGTGSRDDDPTDVLEYEWRQIEGPAVTLSSLRVASPSFTAPSVEGTTQLVFGLVVRDGEEASAEDRVVVLVRAVPDPDGDGLDDEEEAVAMTDPARGDTDRDGALDGIEVASGSDPLDEDSDEDGVRDGAEIQPFEDTDSDGRVNALDVDSDGDGLNDGTELGVTEPTNGTDTATGAFVPDADRSTMTDPVSSDTDGDQLADGSEDSNHNGRVDLGESDPNDATSTAGCTPERTCPAPLACIQDACRAMGGADGGQCVPLANRGLECCMNACAGGTPVAPMCAAGGRSEQCPIGARECMVGSCTDEPVNPPASSGCGCAIATEDRSSGSLLWLAALVAITSVRRRGRDRS
jgi:MYXO-CTERM domain-containing protein